MEEGQGTVEAVNHHQSSFLLGGEKNVALKTRHHAHTRPVLEAITRARWLHTGDKQASGKNIHLTSI